MSMKRTGPIREARVSRPVLVDVGALSSLDKSRVVAAGINSLRRSPPDSESADESDLEGPAEQYQ
jgi:hypothetical protein